MSDSRDLGTKNVTLAGTHHDPTDAMLPQALRVLPRLHALYEKIVILATPTTSFRTIETLREHQVNVVRETQQDRQSLETLGLARRDTLKLAASFDPAYVHFGDWDRLLHWAEFYPDELRDIVDAIPRHDLLILGRTKRAFDSHPRVQRDTEALVNHVFGLAFGDPLDVTAASRGFSRRALDALLDLESPEPTVGNDCAWPLFLVRMPELIVGYAATEGLEWETPDRYADEIAAAGGLDSWIANFDAEPQTWEFRTKLALYEIAAINRWR